MYSPDNRITKFIKKHHVLTLATAVSDKPWCSNCFYSFIEEENKLIVTSDIETKHIQDVKLNNFVSGSIVLETHLIGKIQGIQFQGLMYEPDMESIKKAKISYLKRFPFASFMDTTLWIIELTNIKMTDNKLGFGKKILWSRSGN